MGDQPYVTLRTRRPTDGSGSVSSGDSTYGSSAGDAPPMATHDISRVSYHVKHLSEFAKTLEDSAARAFPNRGRSQRYKKVQALLLHWKCDDLFVLPELEDLEQCLREDYSFNTETFPIPSDNPHLELMLKVGAMIKEHESSDTLFVIYYGGHARIDDSRQSTWCATRNSDSPWLQWSAIQTLLERSLSDVLILLDCCAGAASATFPSGNSITETISASSWDAIAPDPGRYSFTSALIEVLQDWKNRTYSAAMLHAEVLARLKHPRPIMRNGKHFEARATPVHFMMTSNHKAPSIEVARLVPTNKRPPSPPQELEPETTAPTGRFPRPQDVTSTEPNEDVPHVMISLALEDDQRLDVNAWENWLSAFPAIAKYVKVQGFFKSHSTLLLLSLPVMVWDLLPENLACNFVAFIRSNNLAHQCEREPSEIEVEVPTSSEEEVNSIYSGSTMLTWAGRQSTAGGSSTSSQPKPCLGTGRSSRPYGQSPRRHPGMTSSSFNHTAVSSKYPWASSPPLGQLPRQHTEPPAMLTRILSNEVITRQMILNQQRSSRRDVLVARENMPTRPDLAQHVQTRLEEYFQEDPTPTVGVMEFLASNLGIETADIDLWFFHRRENQQVSDRLQNLRIDDHRQEPQRERPRMILPGHLNSLLEILPPDQVMLVDLRSSTDYERSHVHESINLRAPASFIRQASFEMIERVFANNSSRKIFNRWYTSQCVVFYDRHVEFPWECRTAEALIKKFKDKGWAGHGFILKGPYREFAISYDKYIAGAKTSDSARSYLKSLEGKEPEKKGNVESQAKFDEWIKLLESEDRVTEVVASVRTERMEAAFQHQKGLEDELERRMPSLYRKAIDLKPVDEGNWERKAGLVEPLSRGLSKMQEAGRAGHELKKGHPGFRGKVLDQPAEDWHDLMDSDEEVEQQQKEQQNDAGFAKAETTTKASSEDAAGKKGRLNILRLIRSGW